MRDALEATARRIADLGRHALSERLRAAVEHTAATHASVVELTSGQLDQIVRDAADRADGRLWRRTLARAGSQELGIGLAAAFDHPAVVRAHAILGAPPEPDTPAPAADRVGHDHAAPPELVPQAIRLAAVHLQGIESLRENEGNLELRFSDAGLDIVSTTNGNGLGRLGWAEIQALYLPRRTGLRRRRRPSPHLLVRTERGEASFKLPGLTEEELRTHLAPMFARAHDGGGAHERT